MKWLRVLLLLCSLLSLLMAGFAFTQPIPVSLPNSSVTAGTPVTVPITVGNLTGRGIIAYQTKILFNSSVLNAIGASSVGTLSALWGSPIVNTSAPGQLILGGFGTSALNGNGVLVNLNFNAVGSSGNMTNLIFEYFIFNSGDPPADTTNGKITVPVNERDMTSLPKIFALKQNHPNPFNPETEIRYDLPKASQVTLSIYNITGQLIRTLVNRKIPAGSHAIQWSGRDDHAKRVVGGVYFYKLTAGEFVEAKKMIFLP